MFNNSVWVEGFGGLASYGPNFNELMVRVADQLAKVLRGARPEELPMEQPNVVELVVNLATARAVGMSIPKTVAARADRVIE
jgi:putative ABC transport system substrate-binding protein